MAQVFLIGLGAGAASALLYASPMSGNPLSIILVLMAALPIMLAGLIWSHRLALTALLAATIGLLLTGGNLQAFGYAVSVGLPAYVLVYLAMLGRPAENAIEWYPAGRLVSWAAVLGAVLIVGVVLMAGTDFEAYRASFRAMFESGVKLPPEFTEKQLKSLGLKSLDEFYNLVSIVLPPWAAALYMITNLFNLWLAGLLAHSWGRLQRPWPHLPSITFPGMTSVMFAVSLVIMFVVPGLIGLISAIFVAVFTIAHSLLGFAALHAITQNVFGRPLLLAMAWLSMLIVWPLLFAAAFGVADQIFNLRGRLAANQPPKPPHQMR